MPMNSSTKLQALKSLKYKYCINFASKSDKNYCLIRLHLKKCIILLKVLNLLIAQLPM